MPLARARANAADSSVGRVTSSPCAPSASATRSYRVGSKPAAVRPVLAIVADLDLMLGVPSGIVADDDDQRETVADRSVELGEVVPEGTVPRDGDDRCLLSTAQAARPKGMAEPIDPATPLMMRRSESSIPCDH